MILLRGLGKHARLSKFLIEHPETAGLLASVNDPLPIAESLEGSPGDYDLVASCYAYHFAPDDANALAEALKSNRELICLLNRRGQVGAEVLFVFERKDQAAIEYESWLREILDSKLQASEGELSSFVNFTMRDGPAIRRRMRADPDFVRKFRSELWPRLVRALPSDHGGFEHVADEPRIWDLLTLPEGEILAHRCSLLAIDLLYGYPEVPGYPNSYAKELHAPIVQLLLQGDGVTIDGLYRYRNEPLFAKLLSRSLSSDTLRAIIAKLHQAGAAYPHLLAKYDRIKSNEGLAEEVGPPSHGLIEWVPLYYTVYEVPRKIMKGRDPSAMDWFQAIADPAFLVVDIVSGGGGKVVRETVTEGGLTVAEAALEKGGGNVWTTTLRHSGLELPTRQLSKEVVEKLREKELAKWTVTNTLTEMQRVIGSTIGKTTTFEVTKPVQLMFRYSGVGRETLKRLAGLEARLFMRSDARVFIRFTNLAGAVVGSRTAAFFERTGKDLVLGALAESEPGQRAIRTAVETGLSAKDQLFQWKKQISAWWLLNLSSM